MKNKYSGGNVFNIRNIEKYVRKSEYGKKELRILKIDKFKYKITIALQLLTFKCTISEAIKEFKFINDDYFEDVLELSRTI